MYSRTYPDTDIGIGPRERWKAVALETVELGMCPLLCGAIDSTF